jgi:hypothetical protein
VIGVPVDRPNGAVVWQSRAIGAGMWAPAGITTDGSAIYSITGNAGGASRTTYLDQVSILRFTAGPSYSGQARDFFAPVDWLVLGSHDLDLCGSAPVVFDVVGTTRFQLVLALGKNGIAYLVDRNDLGGIGAPLAQFATARGELVTSAAVYRTEGSTYIAYQGPCPAGSAGNLAAIRVSATSSLSMSAAWCQNIGPLGPYGLSGAAIVTMTDALGSNAMVWVVSAEGDGRLRAFDGSTGRAVFGGGSAQDVVSSVQHFQPLIAVNGRLFIAGNTQLWAFTLR